MINQKNQKKEKEKEKEQKQKPNKQEALQFPIQDKKEQAQEFFLNFGDDNEKEKEKENEEQKNKKKELKINGFDLKKQKLFKVPSFLFQYYKNIVLLDVSFNYLETLPEDLFDFQNNLKTLIASDNQLISLPSSIGFLTRLEKLDLHSNLIVHLPYEISHLFALQEINLTSNPIANNLPNELLLSARNLTQFYLHSAIPKFSKLMRPWINGSREILSMIPQRELLGKESIVVMSFNILSNTYANKDLYSYTPNFAIEWMYRRKKIIQEIFRLEDEQQQQNQQQQQQQQQQQKQEQNHFFKNLFGNKNSKINKQFYINEQEEKKIPDIICLQEVEWGQFKEFFEPKFDEWGYSGIFKIKARYWNMPKSEADRVDGVAIFFSKTKFDYIKHTSIDFPDVAQRKIEMEDLPKVALDRLGTRDQVAQILVLKCKATGKLLMVANVHTYWSPMYPDVKALQVQFLLEEIEHLKQTEFPGTPVFICGDFNSMYNSAAIDLLSQGSVDPKHPDFVKNNHSNGNHYSSSYFKTLNSNSSQGKSNSNKSTSNEKDSKLDKKIKSEKEKDKYQYYDYGSYSKFGLNHSISKLTSLYQHFLEFDSNPNSFTNLTLDFEGVIDYIWYDADSLIPIGLLYPLDKKQSKKKYLGFPNCHFPSDHIPLMGEFLI
ncbi:hypothetical protein M0813_16773 [Anaeramoeba flamelloides]|uniref:Endonuclease/exonuclease/phosphatase domain-containing protein n=1 Tax=Anaeramoeba flamelloides TaxID=1746091 RepID=A0ABQ8YYS2_9EUKA|nr:hypothetical protein M0813_16773 [Anaeramoeba flamelloides]